MLVGLNIRKDDKKTIHKIEKWKKIESNGRAKSKEENSIEEEL